MDAPSSYQPYLDQLISFASTDARKDDLLAAKAEYFHYTGEVFADDKSFEMRMASFLEFYLFDRVSPMTGLTPAAEFVQVKRAVGDEAAIACVGGFTSTVHGLFEVRKLGKGSLTLRELYSGKDHLVTERRQMAGLTKGDVIEARLLPFKEMLLFSGAFLFHPQEVGGLIRKEVKRRKKQEPSLAAGQLTWDCSRMALKVERYRQIPVEKIYDFKATRGLGA